MPSHLNGFEYILPSFFVLYRLLCLFVTSQTGKVIGREMETAFLIVVPKAGWDMKYLHISMPQESNGEMFFRRSLISWDL